MTPDEFEAVLIRGHEMRGVEFKGPGSLADSSFAARVVRASLAMANRRGGGLIVIGVGESKGSLDAVGLSADLLETWSHDDLADKLSKYADPYISFELERFEHNGRTFLILHVHEFEEVPVFCKSQLDPILKKGACYVRSLRKPESAEVATSEDMRQLVDLATEKRLRQFLATAERAGAGLPIRSARSDESRFAEQLEDFVR